MSEDQVAVDNGTPIHLWIVGVLTLLWNAGGAFDYLMTQTQNEGYMSNFTPEQLEYFYGFPTWAVAFWALAVWSAVLGSVLLLMRKQLAVGVFLVSLVSMVILTIYNYGLSNGLEVAGSAFDIGFTVAIFVASVLLYLYAKAMRDRGVLR